MGFILTGVIINQGSQIQNYIRAALRRKMSMRDAYLNEKDSAGRIVELKVKRYAKLLQKWQGLKSN